MRHDPPAKDHLQGRPSIKGSVGQSASSSAAPIPRKCPPKAHYTLAGHAAPGKGAKPKGNGSPPKPTPLGKSADSKPSIHNGSDLKVDLSVAKDASSEQFAQPTPFQLDAAAPYNKPPPGEAGQDHTQEKTWYDAALERLAWLVVIGHYGPQIIQKGAHLSQELLNNILSRREWLSLGLSIGMPGIQKIGVSVPCFAAGTRISTDRGEVLVDDLRERDRVHVVLGEDLKSVVWIGHRDIDCRRHPDPCKVWPVRIAAGAFGRNIPRSDLYLSPDHSIYVPHKLIPVKYLINGTTVAQTQREKVTYYHVELPDHDVMLAEGLPVESYLDTGDRSDFANGGGPMKVHPDFASAVREARGCAPMVVSGSELEAVRAKIKPLAVSYAGYTPIPH